jgi:hypothetical protein
MVRIVASCSALAFLICVLSCTNKPRTDEVNAGFFQKTGYNPIPHTLTIYFKDGSTYAYKMVPEKVYSKLVRSDHPGLFFNDEIKGKYDFELIDVRTTPLAPPQLTPKIAPPEPTFPCSEFGSLKRKIKSEVLDFAAYDARDKCMILYFDRRGVYEYGGVPPQIFDRLIQVPNAGSFFNKHIWGKYPKRRIQGR